MKIHVSLVGVAASLAGDKPDLWTEVDSVPREGEALHIPGIEAQHTYVRTVVWYPFGSDEYEENERFPFVYIVVGDRRP